MALWTDASDASKVFSLICSTSNFYSSMPLNCPWATGKAGTYSFWPPVLLPTSTTKPKENTPFSSTSTRPWYISRMKPKVRDNSYSDPISSPFYLNSSPSIKLESSPALSRAMPTASLNTYPQSASDCIDSTRSDWETSWSRTFPE